MNDGPWPVLTQQSSNQFRIANIAEHQLVPGIALKSGEIFWIARISEQIKIDHVCASILDPLQHKIGSYKPRAASDEDGVVDTCHRSRDPSNTEIAAITTTR
jgi:hypothetical protein